MHRILHLLASDSIGVPEKQLLHHARNTRDASYEVIVGSFQNGAEAPEVLSAAGRMGIETVCIPGGVRPGLVDDVAQYLVRHRIDLICTHGYKSNVVGHFAAKHAEVPCVPFVHGFAEESWQVTLYERLERNLLARSPVVVCTSKSQARELARLRRGRSAPLVIPNAVLPAKGAEAIERRTPSREDLGLAARAFLFGAAGRFSRENGHRFLLDAFALLQKMLPEKPMKLLLLGEGSEEAALRAQSRKLGVEPQVCFAGFQQKPASWMRAMDCLVHPSTADGTPSAVLEAMLLGVPVIATSVGGVLDVLENGETGLVVEPASPAALAEAMEKVVLSSGLRRQLALAGRQHVCREFSPMRQRSLLERLYEMMLRGTLAMDSEEPVHVVA